MRTTRVLGGAVAVAALALTTACATGDGGDGADSGNGDAGADALEVCYITAADSHAYATPANEAVDAAAEEAGVEVTRLSQDFDVQTGTEQLSTCVAQNPDGILLWPLDPQAYIPGLIAAQDADIPVVLINTPMGDDADDLVASFTGPDVYEEGVLAANVLNEELGGEGSIVIIAGQAGNATTTGRNQGFLDRLQELDSNIEVLQTINADFDQQKALVASRDLITRFGEDIDGVYANDDTMARGFIDAWKEAHGSSEDIPPIVGINGQTDAFQSIKDGEMLATILQSPVEDGALALETIVKVINGDEVPDRIGIDLTVIDESNVDTEEPAL